MHPLWGPIRKVYRAQNQVETLVGEIDAFIKADRYGIVVAERNPNTSKYALRARTTSEVEPPLRWSILIGEIAYNLRSALDQLACQLAVKTSGPAPEVWQSTSFPICLYGARSSRPKRERWSDTRASIRFLSKPDRAALERLQPYSRWNRERGPYRQRIPSGRLNPLWLLHELNNADKHRLIQVTARIARGMGIIVRAAPPTFKFRSVSPKLGVKLVNNAYVGTIDAEGGFEGVDMHLRLSPEVVFWDGCDAVAGLPVRATMEDILFQVHYRILVPLCAHLPPLDPPWGPPE